jgi:hypothetical protein
MSRASMYEFRPGMHGSNMLLVDGKKANQNIPNVYRLHITVVIPLFMSVSTPSDIPKERQGSEPEELGQSISAATIPFETSSDVLRPVA